MNRCIIQGLGPKSIRYGMAPSRESGFGGRAIIEERTANGPLPNLPDLCRRASTCSAVNRRVFRKP